MRKQAHHQDGSMNAMSDAMSGKETPDGSEHKNVTQSLLSFVIPSLTIGGAEQVTVNIVNGLSARGYDVELVVSRFEGELKSQIASDVKVVKLSLSRTPVFGVAADFPSIVAYLREREPVALFPHLPRMSVVCLAAAQAAGVDTPVFPTHHSAFGKSEDPSMKDRTVEWLVRRLYPTADRIVSVSEGVANSISEQTAVDRSDISVLHNPIEVETVRERSLEPVENQWIEDDTIEVVLFVGRVEAQKDLETWLHTFERVHRRDPMVRAVIAGQGSRREELRTLAHQLDIGEAVSIPGYVENPYRYMAKASVFLLSSRYEGLPTVLIESLACGCPVVATDCPSGPNEILDGGVYGRLAPVGDDEALADAVTATIKDPIPSRKLRDRADDFAPESVFDDYERFISEHVISQ